MNAIAYINAKRKQPALYYANRCRAITEAYKAEMKDFDLAHSSLLMAMASRLNRNDQEADQYLQEAEKLGEAIQNPGDKKIFTGDLNAFIL